MLIAQRRLAFPVTLALLLGAIGGFVLARMAHAPSRGRSATSNTAAAELIESPSEATSLELLEAMGYVGNVLRRPSGPPGVQHHDRARAFPGYNLFAVAGRPEARLIDNDGKTVFRWQSDTGPWQDVLCRADGSLLVVIEDQRLLELDRNSELVWEHRARYHHGLSVDADGRILAIAREEGRDPDIHPTARTISEYIHILSGTGELLHRISVLAVLRRSPYRFLIPVIRGVHVPENDTRVLDVLHVNHVEAFDGTLAARDPIYARGNLLVSIRNINTVMILDPEGTEILWLWGPSNLTFQHHPQLLPNGDILIFNNGEQRSSIYELEPLSQQIRWRYGPNDHFFTIARGSVQRLPNGNTLITESSTGSAFEITVDAEEVWRFVHPAPTLRPDQGILWRMTRLPVGALPFLTAEKLNR